MNGNSANRVALAAGGTGGHMFPAQALARELLRRGKEVVLVTDHRGGGFGPDLPQVETYAVNAGGIAGAGLFHKVKSLVRLGAGCLQARKILSRSSVDTVVGFGGYPSVPTVLAGHFLGLRIILHEQNSVLGRANRMLSRYAQAIATSFEDVDGIAPALKADIALTGNPVRGAISDLGQRPYAVPQDSGPLRLLIVGGSQGAVVFNDVVPKAIESLPDDLRRRLEVTQQVPGADLERVEEAYRSCGVRCTVAPFIEDIPERLATAHLVISRSGASTIAELAAAGRPAVMVPYPSATDDHQTSNAQALTEVGGGWLIPQSALSVESLAERLMEILAAPALLTRAARCARKAAHPDAAVRLADIVCNVAKPNGGENEKEAAA